MRPVTTEREVTLLMMWSPQFLIDLWNYRNCKRLIIRESMLIHLR